jgi:hypothetical protein
MFGNLLLDTTKTLPQPTKTQNTINVGQASKQKRAARIARTKQPSWVVLPIV